MRFAVFDIDNCLCSASGELGVEAMRLVHEHAAAGDTILVCTSRPECDRASTEEWLRRNGLPFWRVLMRPAGDVSSSVALKPRLLREEGLLPPNEALSIACVYDDRRDILSVFDGYGVRTRCVAIVPGLHEGARA